jgi:hypothetical protein
MSPPVKHYHHSPLANATNAALIVLVAIPAVWFGHYFVHACPARDGATIVDWEWGSAGKWLTREQWCELAERPLLAVNVVFMLNVCVLFWLISLVQRSTWVGAAGGPAHGAPCPAPPCPPRPVRPRPALPAYPALPTPPCPPPPQLIDPYWTLLPPLVCLWYEGHPAAVSDRLRGAVASFLVWLWSFRLTHSYFRRCAQGRGSAGGGLMGAPGSRRRPCRFPPSPLRSSAQLMALLPTPPTQPHPRRAGRGGSLASARTGALPTWLRCLAPTGGGPPSRWPSCPSS